ncbi:cytochrome P450 [Syncephalastrum racemosum]|uniref:Cytochrome P450 n=1 Tax=Syncephalastrum racemosum TaxID=13706 RepID=A0A1X2H6W3_SYNRA|nr:cytochrome P450 [Syncephalastrum racemosum]
MGLEGTLIHRFVGGPNIVFLSGHDWKRHRKIANPAFHRAFPVKMFANQTHDMFAAMEGQDTFDVVDLFSRLTLDAIGRAGFGFNFNALRDKDNKWVTGYNSIKDGMIKPLFIMFPIFDTKLRWMFPERCKAHAHLTEFLAMLDQIIENKRNVIAEKKLASIDDNENDLLSLMIESGLEEGDAASLSNEELKANLCIFFLAGHDTTAYALSYIIYEMARHPDVQEKARQEALSILGDGSDDVTPTFEQTKQMTYLNAVIKETLRLYNPVYGTTTRVANEDCDLNGHYMPKGTMVNINIFDLHRNPAVWESPDEFKPERFLPGGEVERQPGSGLAWVPFSNGGRQCVGMQFSLVEQRVVLSLLLRKFTFHLPENSIHKEKLQLRGIVFGITSVNDLTVTFKNRH